jgi:hypothetical protein
MDKIDWSGRDDVERVPGRVSGQPVVVGTRILAQGLIDNADDFTAEEIASEADHRIRAETGPFAVCSIGTREGVWFSGLEDKWKAAFGYDFTGLTQGEATYLVRSKPADALGDRLIAGGQAGKPSSA